MKIYTCEQCGREFQAKIHHSICPICEETALFAKARDFIRENEVNEFQVADHLNIPIWKVKQWIKDGKITYKLTEANKKNYIAWKKCEVCGESISFGNICSKCFHKETVKGFYNTPVFGEKGQMRFLDQEQLKK